MNVVPFMPTKKSVKPKNNGSEDIPLSAPVVFPVVGIGASAGELRAFEEFFSAMPINCGHALTLISHLDLSQVRILPQRIQRKTGMKVFQVFDNMDIAPNEVYVIPPGETMEISLQLFEVTKPRGVNIPIGIFFRSLAKDPGGEAVGIVLSGTDGAFGLRAIQAESGVATVQGPQTRCTMGCRKAPSLQVWPTVSCPPGRVKVFTAMNKLVVAVEQKRLRMDGEPIVMVVSAAPVSFRKREGASVKNSSLRGKRGSRERILRGAELSFWQRRAV